MRCAELDGLVKKLYEANATGKLPDKHFSRLLTEYNEEQATLETSMTEWQKLIDNWNADRVRMTEFIDLAKRYSDFSELTTPMLNEFIEKIIVHEGSGRGKQRRQRLDFYFNFIGAFEVPADVVTPMEQEAECRQQEEQAEKEEHSKALAQARYEKRKQERREFTARKRAGLLTTEEQAEEERRLERNRAYQKKQRDKKKASQPAGEAPQADIGGTCQAGQGRSRPHPGRSGTTGSPPQSEKRGFAGFESPRRN